MSDVPADGGPADPQGPDGDQVKGPGPDDDRPPRRLDRRRFLGWTAAGGAATAAVALGLVDADRGSNAKPAASPHHAVRGHATGHAAADRAAHRAGRSDLPVSPAIVAENARTGHAWWVTTPQRPGDIWGYADQVSAVDGDTVTLFVSTRASRFHVEAYRMGYYQGIGGRLVWQSAELPGSVQPPPALIHPTNTIECSWSPSLSVPIDPTWPPGAYLLKLVGNGGQQQFIPLCVRDDTSTAAIVLQHSVTTWQAYNRWGGYSLYYGNAGGALSYTHDPGGGSFADRARIVSFDRPYDYNWASGAADFVGNEFPVIYQAERLGLDVTYWTDIDLHARPTLLPHHKALVSLGHDEYWSQPMRNAAAQAVAGGVNLAFLGANACYRQIRLQPSALGADRVQVCYKSATEDPLAGVDDSLVTVNWPDPPVLRPEAQLIGSTYQDIGALADMVVTDPSSWLLEGVELPAGNALPGAIVGEFDRYVPGGDGPTNVDVIAHSLVRNRQGNYSDVTWYTVTGGGGVFATGNAEWVGNLSDSTLVPPNVVPAAIPGVTAPLLAMMENLYAVIGAGPASHTRPSTGNWTTVYRAGTGTGPAVDTVNSA
jgi:hypothetical protein